MRTDISSRAGLLAILVVPLSSCASAPVSDDARLSSRATFPPDAAEDATRQNDVDLEDIGGRGAVTFDFKVKGAQAAIQGSASLGPIGSIGIAAYPTAADAPVVFGPLPVGFDGAFSPAYCAGIRNRARMAVGSSPLANLQYRFVRRSGGVPLRMRVSPFVGNRFVAAAAAAAARAGAPGTAFIVDNPLQLTGVKLRLVVEPDALSNVIGELDIIEREQSAYLDGQLAGVAVSGDFATALGAKDVLCDIASGHIRIFFTVTGNVNGGAYSGETTARGFEPL